MGTRLGIFGGTFDPIHNGHLLIAEICREELRLDKVAFVPAYQSPLKLDRPPIAAKDRVNMVKLAIGGHPQFMIDSQEIDRGETSFTVETLRNISSSAEGDDQLFLIIGADSLASFDRWKSPSEILSLATLAVVERGGEAAADLSVLSKYVSTGSTEDRDDTVLRGRQVEISSSDIRERLAKGKSIRYQVPAAVEQYIKANGLYQNEV